MFIYCSIFLYLLYLTYRFDSKGISPQISRKAANHFFVLEYIFILVVGLSYRVGTDALNYMEAFKGFPTFSTFSLDDLLNFEREPFWVLLNITGRSTINDFSFVMMFCAFILNIPLFKLIREECKYPFTVLLLYFLMGWLNVSFEMLRQTCATGFILWGSLYLLKGNRRAFLLRAWPAVFFHITGILLVLLIWAFSYIKINKVSLFICTLIFFVGIMIKDSFEQFFTIFNIMSAEMGATYMDYINSSQYGLLERSFFGYLQNFCLNFFLPATTLFYFYNKNYNTYFQRILMLYVVLLSLSSVLGIIYRMAASLQWFYFIAMATMLFEWMKSKKYKLLQIGVFVLLLYSVNNAINPILTGKYEDYAHNNRDVRYFPYTNVITKEVVPERESSCLKMFQTN